MCTLRWGNNFWRPPFSTSSSPLPTPTRAPPSSSFYPAQTPSPNWLNSRTRRRSTKRCERLVWAKIRDPRLRRWSRRLASTASGFCSKIVTSIRAGCPSWNKYVSRWKCGRPVSKVAVKRVNMAVSACGSPHSPRKSSRPQCFKMESKWPMNRRLA